MTLKPASVKHKAIMKTLQAQYCRQYGYTSLLLHNMMITAEQDEDYADKFDEWIKYGRTLFLRDELAQHFATKRFYGRKEGQNKCRSCGRIPPSRDRHKTIFDELAWGSDWEKLDSVWLTVFQSPPRKD